MRTPLPPSRLAQTAGRLAAALGLGLSASIMLGWLTSTEALLLRVYDGPPMVLWAAVANAAVGVVLLLLGRLPARSRTALLRTVGSLVSVLGVWSLLEIATGRNLGLDFPALHAAVQAGNLQPGRASPYSSVAFILLGLALVSLGGRRWQRPLGAAAVVALGAIGVGGLLAYALRLHYLNIWPHQTGLAATTALVFSLYALALAAHWGQTAGRNVTLTPVQKIHLLAIAVLAGVSLLVGIAGLAAMQRQLQVAQDRTIDAVLNDRQHHIDADIQAQFGRARRLAKGLSDAAATGIDPGVTLHREAPQWRQEGVLCAQLLGPDGVVRDSVGACANATAPVLALQAPLSSRLVVDHGYRLESTVPLGRDGQSAAALRFQMPLPRLSEMLAMTVPWEGGRLVVCGAAKDAIACFGPHGERQSPAGTASVADGMPASGRASDAFARDSAGATVLTRWRPVHQTGLALGLSVPTVVLYAPARTGMQFMSALLVLAVALGAAAIHRGLRPLTSALDAARHLAAENLDLFRSASDSAQEGIMLLQAVRRAGGAIADFDVVYVNDSGLRQLGRPASEVLGRRFLELTKDSPRGGENFARYREVVETGEPAKFESPCFASTQDSSWISRNITKVRDGVMVVARDVTQSRLEAQRLADSARVDELTGLPNARALRARLVAACEAARADGGGVAVAYCDMDDFKLVNDRRGHACGDDMLVRFARTLQAAVRRSDLVGRLHGDEFIVILEHLETPEEAQQVVQDLRATLDQPVAVCGVTMELRASVGMAYAAGTQAEAGALLKMADADMYRQKVRRKGAARDDASAGEGRARVNPAV